MSRIIIYLSIPWLLSMVKMEPLFYERVLDCLKSSIILFTEEFIAAMIEMLDWGKPNEMNML